MKSAIPNLSNWIAHTWLSENIAAFPGAIATLQTIHILAISILMGSALMVNLRLLDLCQRDMPLQEVFTRFLPWLWSALFVLAISGSMLIIAEPRRSLPNPVFQLKMALLGAAILVTQLSQPRQGQRRWKQLGCQRSFAWVLGILSSILWIAIVFAGRWIAYV